MSKTLRHLAGILAFALVAGFASATPPALAHSIPMTDRQMVYASEHIVVAVVESASARWNPQHTLIFTDYTLRVDDRLKGGAPERMTLSVPGGSLDGETQGTCLSTPLATGSRYLLFLAGLENPTLEPVVGAQEGIFRELVGANGERYAGPGGSSAPALVKGKPVEFRNLVEGVRALARRVAEHPEAADDPVTKSLGGGSLPAKGYEPSATIEKGRAIATPGEDPGVAAPPPPWTDRADAGLMAGAPLSRAAGPSLEEKYVYQNRPPAPIIYNNFPAGFSFAPYDQYQMAYWNTYAKNLFRVYTNPTGTWAFGNGVFDLAGFPGNDQMQRQFGANWGATTLGITYWRTQNGAIIEADIALNPAYGWTINDNTATQATGAYSFQHTMLHELGHAWGLQHPFEAQNVWWDSVMNYPPKPFRLARLQSDDTTAARTAYPGIAIRDGAVSSYTTQDSTTSSSAVYVATYPSPSVVHAGGNFTLINAFKLENTGTVDLVNPKIEVYLVPQRFSFTGAILLRTLQYSLTLKPYNIGRLLSGTLTVPKSVKPGTYYLAFYYRDSLDKYPNNNSAWSSYNVKLQVLP